MSNFKPNPIAMKNAASVITGIKVLSVSKKKKSMMCAIKVKGDNKVYTRHIPDTVISQLVSNNVSVTHA